MQSIKKNDTQVQFVRFATVGALNTVNHLVIVYFLVSFNFLNLLVANIVAFVSATIISFVLNNCWTFSLRGISVVTVKKYLFFISLSTLIIYVWTNIAETLGVSPLITTIALAILLPILSFVIFKIWVFNGRHHSKVDSSIE